MPKKGEYKKTASERSKYQRSYNSTPEAKKDRAARNKARREAIRDGRVKKGDGKDIDHKNGNPRDNRKSNTQVMSKSKNRALNQHDKRQK